MKKCEHFKKLANEHHSDQKKCCKRFLFTLLLCKRSRKDDYVNSMPEKVASRRILTKSVASLVVEYKAMSKDFAASNHQCIYSYSPHKETY